MKANNAGITMTLIIVIGMVMSVMGAENEIPITISKFTPEPVTRNIRLDNGDTSQSPMTLRIGSFSTPSQAMSSLPDRSFPNLSDTFSSPSLRSVGSQAKVQIGDVTFSSDISARNIGSVFNRDGLDGLSAGVGAKYKLGNYFIGAGGAYDFRHEKPFGLVSTGYNKNSFSTITVGYMALTDNSCGVYNTTSCKIGTVKLYSETTVKFGDRRQLDTWGSSQAFGIEKLFGKYWTVGAKWITSDFVPERRGMSDPKSMFAVYTRCSSW